MRWRLKSPASQWFAQLFRFFRRRSKKTSKLRVTGLCERKSLMTGQFPTQTASNAEKFPFDDVIRFWEFISTETKGYINEDWGTWANHVVLNHLTTTDATDRIPAAWFIIRKLVQLGCPFVRRNHQSHLCYGFVVSLQKIWNNQSSGRRWYDTTWRFFNVAVLFGSMCGIYYRNREMNYR